MSPAAAAAFRLKLESFGFVLATKISASYTDTVKGTDLFYIYLYIALGRHHFNRILRMLIDLRNSQLVVVVVRCLKSRAPARWYVTCNFFVFSILISGPLIVPEGGTAMRDSS